MTFSFVLNILIAVLWMFLSKQQGLGNFLIGFLLGFLLMAFFPSLFRTRDYVRRIRGFVVFLLRFNGIFLLANLTVAKQVLFVPRKQIQSRFMTIDIAGLHHREVLLYAHFITLTPGTTCVDILESSKRLLVHAMSLDDDDTIRKSIREKILKPLLQWTR